MSYLTHGRRSRPKNSVTVGRTLAALVVVFGPYIVVGYFVWEWLT